MPYFIKIPNTVPEIKGWWITYRWRLLPWALLVLLFIWKIRPKHTQAVTNNGQAVAKVNNRIVDSLLNANRLKDSALFQLEIQNAALTSRLQSSDRLTSYYQQQAKNAYNKVPALRLNTSADIESAFRFYGYFKNDTGK